MVYDLSLWRSAKKNRSRPIHYKEWSTLHFEELFSVLKSIEEGRGSVTVGASWVTVSTAYGSEVMFHADGRVSLGDRSCTSGERVHFMSKQCFGLYDRPTQLRFLGLLLTSVADGMGFVERSAGHGVLYSDRYRCWAVFSSDGRVEFSRLFQLSF
jgi:hypothetical protein